MSLLEINHMKKSFGEVEVLKDISMKVEEGEVFGIIGPSGSGKSTLLRCATGLETPDSGEIHYNGTFGLVFQNFNLFPHFSVLKNSQIVFLPEDYLCAQKDIREMFSPKYMESFRHADSPELQEVLSVSHFPQHIYHSPRQTILTFQVLCFYIFLENQTTTPDQYIEISVVHNRIAASRADSRSVL